MIGAMRLILVRHGESVGNIDESLFCTVPDHAMELTIRGREQSQETGRRLRELLGDRQVDVYVSPYRRTHQSLEWMALAERVRRVREEPRLREQDWGNLQDEQQQIRQKAERNAFGHFFYRLQSGESGADVYDRVSGFLAALMRPQGMWPRGASGTGYADDDVAVLVTHGLAMRLICMSLFGWTVPEFESLSNPANGDFRVLTHHDHTWTLDRPFDTWR